MVKLYIIFVRKMHIISTFSAILIFLICIGLFLVIKSLATDSTEVTSPTPLNPADSGRNISKGGKLAIIIDDFGQNRRGVNEIISIDRPLTFAIMPFMKFSQDDAHIAHEKGFEVIVHLPLQGNGSHLDWVGPRPILVSMKEDEIRQVTLDAFDDIPYAVGANIHMGSKAGSDKNVISTILDIIKEKGLYFVDSRSCYNPIAKKIADQKDIMCLERDFFLDGKKSKAYTKSQLIKAQNLALEKGMAIAIGHVGTEGGIPTAEAIREMLPEFDRNNVKLVFVSELFK